jgi:hypothetical protein
MITLFQMRCKVFDKKAVQRATGSIDNSTNISER